MLSSIADCVSKGIVDSLVTSSFFQAFANAVDYEMLLETGHKQVNWIIWSFMRVGEDARPWLRRSATDLLKLFASADLDVTFWFYWDLFQVDHNLCREFSDLGIASLGPRVSADMGASSLALIGLLGKIGVFIETREDPDPKALVTALAEDNTPARIIFALHGLLMVNTESYQQVILGLEGSWGGFRNHIEELISLNPLESARALLLATLDGLLGQCPEVVDV
jgi:hypothetical protein